MDDFYPMPAFVRIAVSDLACSMAWYESVLNFRRVFLMPGPEGVPTLAHLRFARYADVLLIPGGKPGDASPGVTLCYTMPDAQTVDALAEHMRRHGQEPAEGPVNRPWNVRELIVLDPDGFRLSFNQQVNAALSMEDVVQQIAQQRASPD